MNEKDFWKGEFGNQYTARNRVDWRARIPFFKQILEITSARSVFEPGCNAGWNLSAIKAAREWDVEVFGEEINVDACAQAVATGLWVEEKFPMEKNVIELVLTAGYLIHHEDPIPEMKRLIEISCDWILAIEYYSEQEEMVEYRGHEGKLWKRDYGKMYQDLGLKLEHHWSNDIAHMMHFDHCHAWLLRKPMEM